MLARSSSPGSGSSPGRSRRAAGADPRRHPAARRRRRARARRDRHGALAAHVARGAGRRRRLGRRSRAAAVDLARLLPTADVQIEHRAEEGVAAVVCGTASYRLHTYNAEDFPRLPESTTRRLFTVDAEALLDTVAQVSRSASRDESRPVLTGILARFERGKLVMAATDSYRLSVKETRARRRRRRSSRRSSRRARSRSSRASPARRRSSSSACRRTRSSFRADDAVLTTRRIDGQFPNSSSCSPSSSSTSSTLPRDELLEVVRRVSVMAQRNSPLRLRFAEGELTSPRRRRTSARRRSRCRRRSQASRSRSASTRSSSATGSSRCSPTRCS